MTRPRRSGPIAGAKRDTYLNIRVATGTMDQLTALVFLLGVPVGDVVETAIQRLCETQGGRVEELLRIRGELLPPVEHAPTDTTEATSGEDSRADQGWQQDPRLVGN